MIIGSRASKSFQLFNHWNQELSEYKDQHSILMAYFRRIYLEDQRPTFDILCVTYHDMNLRVSDERLDAWMKKQFALEVRVRLLGSDMLGLEEYIQQDGYEIKVDRNPNINYDEGIDWGYYLTTLRPFDGGYTKYGYGATRNESLAFAFMK